MQAKINLICTTNLYTNIIIILKYITMIEIKIQDISKNDLINYLTPYEKQKLYIKHYIKKEADKASNYSKSLIFSRLARELGLSVQRVRDIYYS